MKRPDSKHIDTISAIITPPGSGGVGIVRVDGPQVKEIAYGILGRIPRPRIAHYLPFKDYTDDLIDQGIALFFRSPNSFTGNDILELQAHGGSVILGKLLERCLDMGSRLARPGEFSERAFLNGKIDLVQAEAIADLIESGSLTAARNALRTLQGKFSDLINRLSNRINNLRVIIESNIDFTEDDVELIDEERIINELQHILKDINNMEIYARQGQLLRDGMIVVIAGRPNSGKSSIFNALAERNTAIVTEYPGTTRDLIKEKINIDGLPLHLIDTAGLRYVNDPVEKEGINRARKEISKADRVLWVFDDLEEKGHDSKDRESLPMNIPITYIRNKIDLTNTKAGYRKSEGIEEIAISAVTGDGIDVLRNHLKYCVGYKGPEEGEFMARLRHLEALKRSKNHIISGCNLYINYHEIEFLAEELRLAHNCMAEITGKIVTEDLLDKIFSTFCIGK